MCTAPSDDEFRTILLSSRPPVRVRDANWPVVATGSFDEHDGGEVASQATRTWRATLRVRQHDDGRTLVYGAYVYDTAHPRERGFEAHEGILLGLGSVDIVTMIREVGEALSRAAEAVRSEHDYRLHIYDAVRRCIADLPAQTLDDDTDATRWPGDAQCE